MEQVICKCGKTFNSREYIGLNEIRHFHCEKCFRIVEITVNICHTSRLEKDCGYYDLRMNKLEGQIIHPEFGPISPQFVTWEEARRWWVSHWDELVASLELDDQETLKKYRNIY